MTTTEKINKKQQAIAKLMALLTRGERLFVVKRFSSHAGDYRTVDVYRARISGTYQNEDPTAELDRITGAVCDATGYRYDSKHESLGIGGSGFNVAQEVVERIGFVLFGDEKAFGYQEI